MVTIADLPHWSDDDDGDDGEGATAPPRSRRIALPMRPASCAVGRQFVRTALEGAGWPGEVDAAVLLASELVAEALRDGRSPCALTVTVDGGLVHLEVAEAAPKQPPGPRRSPQGRGVALLDELASAWGSRSEPDAGTTIWFELTSSPG